MSENAKSRKGQRWISTRSKLHCALAALIVVVAACAGGGQDRGSGGVEFDVANCAGFTAEDAATVLEVEASAIEDSSQSLGDDSKWCIFAEVDDSSVSVNFTVSRAESSDAAAEEFAQFLSHAGVANDVLGDEGDKAHMVPNVGDEAVWTPVPGILVVRFGRYSLQVNAPGDEPTQLRIAHQILDRQ